MQGVWARAHAREEGTRGTEEYRVPKAAESHVHTLLEFYSDRGLRDTIKFVINNPVMKNLF